MFRLSESLTLTQPLQVYISDLSPPQQRGFLGASGTAAISAGVSAVYALGAALPWRVTALACAAMPALGAVAFACFCPDSPAWLFLQGREEEARSVTTWYANKSPGPGVFDLFGQLPTIKIPKACSNPLRICKNNLIIQYDRDIQYICTVVVFFAMHLLRPTFGSRSKGCELLMCPNIGRKSQPSTLTFP